MGFQLKFLYFFVISIVYIHDEVTLGAHISKREESVVQQIQVENDPFPPEYYYMKVYFFNTTNAEGILKQGERPKLFEIGPYGYKERRVKVDVKFDDKDNTISYRQIKTYFFQKEDSCPTCELADIITIPNIPAISIVTIAQNREKTEQNQLKFLLRKIPLYKSATVRELLFDGYLDPFVKIVQDNTGQQILPNDTFGILYGTNNTDDGVYVVHAGGDDPSKLMQIVSWQGMTKLPYWPEGTACSMINGTDGSQFSPFVTKDTTLRMFFPEIYRSVFMMYEKEIEIFGIGAYRFAPTFDLFGDPTLIPENACFSPYDDVLPSGVFNISSARNGAPILFSHPHFYLADPMLFIPVDGLNPSKELHQTVIDVEPTTGTVINSARKLQVNVYMKTPPFLLGEKYELGQMRELVHPILWIDEGTN